VVQQEPWAELGDAVGAIRAQLQQALDEGDSKGLKFRCGPVELEFSVEVRKDAEARTRVFVVPWSGEARGGFTTDRVQRIKVTLQPVDGEGGDAVIHGRQSGRPA
jgi:hypothetical protein